LIIRLRPADYGGQVRRSGLPHAITQSATKTGGKTEATGWPKCSGPTPGAGAGLWLPAFHSAIGKPRATSREPFAGHSALRTPRSTLLFRNKLSTTAYAQECLSKTIKFESKSIKKATLD
jgi:hypothetical protein